MARGIMGGRGKKKQPRGTRKMHVRRGDRVKVVSGNYKGMEGRVTRVIPDENKVVVEGVNQRTKHVRATQGSEGGRITFEAPIHASNVMLLDPGTGEPTRVRKRVEADGTKERIAAKSGKPIPEPKG